MLLEGPGQLSSGTAVPSTTANLWMVDFTYGANTPYTVDVYVVCTSLTPTSPTTSGAPQT